MLAEWPLARPADWLARANQPQTEMELEATAESGRRGRPFGPPDWQASTADLPRAAEEDGAEVKYMYLSPFRASILHGICHRQLGIRHSEPGHSGILPVLREPVRLQQRPCHQHGQVG